MTQYSNFLIPSAKLLQLAFNEFHFNIHDSALPGIGAIDTLGPQDGAPGLHDGLGADMTAIRGCG